MWELDHKEGWAPQNWYFQTVVLEKTLESPLDSKEIQPVNTKGRKSTLNIHWEDYWCWSWSSNTLATWWKELTHWKRLWCWEPLRAGGEEGEMVGWHHQLNGHEFEQTLGNGQGQESLACAAVCGVAKSHNLVTEHTHIMGFTLRLRLCWLVFDVGKSPCFLTLSFFV